MSVTRAQELDALLTFRDAWNGDADDPLAAPGAPANPAPLVQNPLLHAGPYSIHVAMMLKAEGLGSMGQDTPDNRRISALRAAELMKQRGLRPTHIARSVPMAVALAYIPTPEEVAAAQLPAVRLAQELVEARSRSWIDPRTEDGLTPSVAYN